MTSCVKRLRDFLCEEVEYFFCVKRFFSKKKKFSDENTF